MVQQRMSTSALPREVCFLLHATLRIRPLPSLSGTGAYKLGVNYAPGVVAQKIAVKMGYEQNLWLHGPDHYITEV
jgi:branched-subunit amino acid aminotransferase/4-amino-4-deoxychorismate lyase